MTTRSMIAADRLLRRRRGPITAACVLAVVVALGLVGCAPPLTGSAGAPKVYRVALFSNREYQPWHDEVRNALERDGFVDGQNLVLEYRYAEGKDDRLDEMAQDLVAEGFDALVVASTPTIAAMQRATSTIPIVMASSADPVASGFVKSIQQPGGNITGIATVSTQLARKRLELLRDMIPGLARVAVVYDPVNQVRREEFEHTSNAAAELGLEAREFLVRDAAELTPVFDSIDEWDAGAAMVLADALFSTNRNALIRLGAAHELPMMFERDQWVEAGGLMSYGPSITDQYRRSGELVSKILKGTKPADIPVEIPPRLELTINRGTAQALGVPEAVLPRADRIVG